jgi:hypothetical protein
MNLSNRVLLILAEKEPQTTDEVWNGVRKHLTQAYADESPGFLGELVGSVEIWCTTRRAIQKQLKYLQTHGEIRCEERPHMNVNGYRHTAPPAVWVTTKYGEQHAAELARVAQRLLAIA